MWETILPEACLGLPDELAAVDRLLDAVFFEPYRAHLHATLGRPSVPIETYLRLMLLKYRYRLGYEPLSGRIAERCRSAAFWAAQDATYDQAVALMHGDDAQAVQAVRIFEDLGADGTARRLRRQLRQRGVRVARGTSRASRDYPAGLTARQAEVLELLAEG